jgi:hypothetical protein
MRQRRGGGFPRVGVGRRPDHLAAACPCCRRPSLRTSTRSPSYLLALSLAINACPLRPSRHSCLAQPPAVRARAGQPSPLALDDVGLLHRRIAPPAARPNAVDAAADGPAQSQACAKGRRGDAGHPTGARSVRVRPFGLHTSSRGSSAAADRRSHYPIRKPTSALHCRLDKLSLSFNGGKDCQ